MEGQFKWHGNELGRRRPNRACSPPPGRGGVRQVRPWSAVDTGVRVRQATAMLTVFEG
jgi:hypothetical protein